MEGGDERREKRREKGDSFLGLNAKASPTSLPHSGSRPMLYNFYKQQASCLSHGSKYVYHFGCTGTKMICPFYPKGQPVLLCLSHTFSLPHGIDCLDSCGAYVWGFSALRDYRLLPNLLPLLKNVTLDYCCVGSHCSFTLITSLLLVHAKVIGRDFSNIGICTKVYLQS